jgi:hypothetical protein
MTLIEVLLVSGLLGLVALAIYQSLSLGMKVWDRSRGAMIEHDIVLAFDQLTRDFHNAVYFSRWPPAGDGSSLQFAALVDWPEKNYETEEGIAAVQQMARVRYEYDGGNRVFRRSEQNYGRAFREAEGKTRNLLENVRAVSFRYFYVTDGGEAASEHVLEAFPSLVEVEVVFADPLGERRLKKLIDFPLNW